MVLAFAGITALAFAGATASAHTSRYPTTLTATYNDEPGHFYGETKSSHTPCTQKRHVTVYRVEPAEKIPGSALSEDGLWSLDYVFLPAGDYYASVSKRKFGPARQRTVCRADTSLVFHFSGS